MFATGSYTGTLVPAGTTFQATGGTAVPRYPTNIYYNVSTEAQEVDEYTTLYDLPTCKPITGVTTCNPAGTPFSMSAIVASVDSGMFSHMMGNDPRPHYFHQTNLMGPSNQVASTGTPPATAATKGDGLFYETMNPLLAEYRGYFATNAPIEQLTMPQIGTLLNEQAAWGTAKASQVTGSIRGSVVTVDNTTSGTIYVPLTGTTLGSPYAGTWSYWTPAGPGVSTYTARAAWPAPPTVPPNVHPPTGPSPGNGHGRPVYGRGGKPLVYFAAQAAPKTVNIKQGTVTVSLTCRASFGKTAKGKVCAGSFTLNISGHALRHTFRFKTGKVDRIRLKLTKPMRAATTAASGKLTAHKLTGKLVITTKLSSPRTHVARGSLTIRT